MAASPRDGEHSDGRQPAPGGAALDALAPGPIGVGGGTALVLEGTQREPLGRGARLRVGGLGRTLDASGVHGADGLRWWAVLPVPAGTSGEAAVELLEGEATLELGTTTFAPWSPAPSPAPEPAGEGPLIAICMATHEPPPDRLRRQIESIRAQSWPRWVCVISDDASSAAGVAAIEEAVAGDPRFHVSRSERRLGFVRNFERAIAMAPVQARLIAPADQDDRWFPEKLAELAATLEDHPAALLAYSDMRIVDGDGTVLSDTFWYLQRNRCDDIYSLLVTNVVTGAASMFRRELLDDALPFPPAHPTHALYHDHWLALCALATSEVAYLDRPTYDYYRYDDSVTVRRAPNWVRPRSGFMRRPRQAWARMMRRARMRRSAPSWERVYRERWLLIRQQATVLELRLGRRMAPRQRRSMGRLLAAERSPLAAGWLVVRCLRPLIGRTETISRERVLLGGLLWRWTRGRSRRRGG
jgi:glycosyltransferase involved in cell wall biosynthesis